MDLSTYVPQVINQTINYPTHYIITNEEYNDILNLLISQGDSAAEALAQIVTELLQAKVDIETKISSDNIMAINYSDGNIQITLDGVAWFPVGSTLEVVLVPHTHGNISADGKLLDATETPVANAVLGTDAEGKITKVTATSGPTPGALVQRDAYGRSKAAAPSANDDIARLMEIKKSGPWVLIQSYTTAGVYSFVAPDFYGDDQPYYIGVYMMGGGGSGGVYSSSDAAASGGAAGYGKNIILQVTPGQNIPVVIGAGGGGVSVTGDHADGNSGGSTSFNGIAVNGGEGGTSWSSSAKGASGGQGSDAAAFGTIYSGTKKNSSKYGCVPTVSYTSSTATPGGMSQSSQDGQNAFDPLMVTLAAGGGAYTNDTQYGATLPDGTKGGDSAAGSDAVAESATGNGNGGGAAVASSGNVTSGAGAPGAIYIYTRTAVI
jgi:hypothetical protein